MEHIEEAGIHSGDSGCSIPPYTLSNKIISELEVQVTQLALELNVLGLMNTQFAIKDQEIFLLEVNPRASRTAPFVSKAIGIQLAKIGALVMAGKSLNDLNLTKQVTPTYFSVKEAVLPFSKFPPISFGLRKAENRRFSTIAKAIDRPEWAVSNAPSSRPVF